MSHPYTIHVGKVEFPLTYWRMTIAVELRNRATARVKVVEVKGRSNSICEETLSQIGRPLTGDVVGDDEVGNTSLNSICDSRPKGVVNVQLSE